MFQLCFSRLYKGWCKCTVIAHMAITIFTSIETCDDKIDIIITPFSAFRVHYKALYINEAYCYYYF